MYYYPDNYGALLKEKQRSINAFWLSEQQIYLFKKLKCWKMFYFLSQEIKHISKWLRLTEPLLFLTWKNLDVCLWRDKIVRLKKDIFI